MCPTIVSRLATCALFVAACGGQATNTGSGGPDAGTGGGATTTATTSTATTTATGGATGSTTTTSASSGAGGTTGAGGTGGTGGSAGATNVDGGNACATLGAAYVAAFAEATRCSTADRAACQAMAPSGLSCGCPVHVQDATKLAEVSAQWIAAGCRRAICDVACINQSVGQCYAPDGGTTGFCVESPVLDSK